MFSTELLAQAKGGNYEAMLDLANSYFKGANTSIDDQKAFYWYSKAYELAPKNTKAINGLADCYRTGKAVNKDLVKAVELYKKSALLNDPYGTEFVGHAYFEGKVLDKNVDKAIEYYEKASKINFDYVCLYLYDTYCEKYDESTANIKYIDFLRLLASQGNTGAMTLLYNYYITDEIVPKDEKTALYYLNQAVEKGNPDAICDLGCAYMSGEVEAFGKDEEKGRTLIEKAASMNSERALYLIADAYCYGLDGYEKDITKAKEYFEKCIEIGDGYYSDALCDLGLELVDSKNSIFDSERGISLLKRASELDNDSATSYLGYMYEMGLYLTADTDKAIVYYKKAVENDHAKSQYRLGRLLLDGLFGAPKDEKLAINLFERAAQQGYLAAMEDLGICAYQGKGMPVDMERARMLFENCAREGLPQSQYDFALMNQYGEGGPANYKAAEYWYNKTIEQDIDVLTKDAKLNLASMLSDITKEYQKAFPIWTELAKEGNADGQYALGLFYANGWAVPQDDNIAKYWIGEAAKQGHPDAINAMDFFKQSYTHSESGARSGSLTCTADISVFKKITIFSTLFFVIGFLISIMISQELLISLIAAYLISVFPLSIMRLKGLKMSGGQAVMTAATGYLANRENGCSFAIAFMLGRWLINYLISVIISPYWYIKSIVMLIKTYSK